MSNDNSRQRFKSNQVGKKALYANYGQKDTPYEKNANFDLSHDTKQYLEEMKKGSNNILVAVRVRPLNTKEYSISNFETVKVLEDKVVVLLDPQNESEPEDAFRNNRNRERQFGFDFVFDKETPTETVFSQTTEFLIEGILTGYNATVFAYGATGAGKTYTMMGYSDSQGVMGLTLNALFEDIDTYKSDREYIVKVSYLEVYNENIRDLLSSEDTNLDLREDPVKGNCVAGINEVITSSASEVLAMLKIGNKNRTMEPTGANQVSSRSHAILQIIVEHKQKDQGTVEEVTIGKLSLVDLAGSERGANTNNRGLRMIEGANINKSLLALGNCITILSEQGDKPGRVNHVPYRDSKLTRLLKDSLGGNCRTVMIANVSPAASCFEDTHNTLKYANRAKNIKTNASRNVLEVANHVAKYGQLIANLKSENEALRRKVQEQKIGKVPIDHNAISHSVNEKLQNKLQEHFDHELELKKRIHEVEDQHDMVGQQIYKSLIDLKTADDKATRDRLTAFKQAQREMMSRIETLQIEYNGLFSKRSVLMDEIQNERKESMNHLTSGYKRLEYLIENMELQHRDKQSDNQLKNKDLQIIRLQNQLILRDEMLKGQKNLLDNNKIKHSINYAKLKSLEALDEEAKVAIALYKGVTSASPPKYSGSTNNAKNDQAIISSTKSASNLPIIHNNVAKIGNNLATTKNAGKKAKAHARYESMDYGFNQKDRKKYTSPNAIVRAKENNGDKRYFDKQLMYKYRYEKPMISVRPKRKLGYLPPLESNTQASTDRGIHKLLANSPQKISVSLSRSADSSTPKRRDNSLDLSYVSTNSSNSQRGKQKVLVGDHRLGSNALTEIMKERALYPHAHISTRYKESPYVLKLKNTPRRDNPQDLELKHIEIPAGLNYKKQNLRVPLPQVRNKSLQRPIPKKNNAV